ncbi:MAG: hypothetical protein ABS81_23355 [Pseudonocardia sp. SCN 72-86]|nr:MAG: hypothetical protein ABS81_23355 [Pseudonocardia sp. SCN 72-86]
MIDRYAEAAGLRCAELTAQREGLAGHRAEVRTVCALARASAQAHATTVVGALTSELAAYVDKACRADRARLPEHTRVAAGRAVGIVVERVERELLPELRRVATVRGLPLGGVDPGPPEGVEVTLPALPPPARPWQLVSGSRTVLPWLGVPIVGAPVVTGSVGPAVAAGVVLLVVTVAARWVAADRARLRRWIPAVAAAVRASVASVLLTRLVQVEQRVVAALDVAVAARSESIEVELAALAEGRGSCART